MMFPQLVLITVLELTWTKVTGLPCTQMFPSQSPPLTVNRVTPSDVAVLSSIGLHMHSTEMSTVVSRLGELMTLFNLHSSLLSQLKQTCMPLSLCKHSTLVEAGKGSYPLPPNNQVVDVDRDWKLVLLLAQVDELCVCDQTAEVDEALQLLHSQLKRTIVSVALWGWRKKCRCMESEGEARLQRVMLTHALQESLDELMVQSAEWGSLDLCPQASKHTDNLMVQMWTHRLQPTSDQHSTEDKEKLIMLPCPTEVIYRQQEMPCEDFSASPSPPTSVHELRPGDIQVVAAVGDSLTAGNGIASSKNNVLDVLHQYRGLSWSIGGEENLTTVTTLPNILKYFNQNLTGFSVGKGKQESSESFLNQAVAGATSNNLLPQVRALVARMKNDSRIDFESDGK
ncbi:hypothetical protein KUCAC02_019867 [Chaenocephalus aceratus]|uniref:Uncharacterized protein n=1 Tax=Chaenocephalus aceratus TaxID=36190 RepID=A0ACB9VQB6_CHAAC|nr:hypothetical protein KUCAC02_019867 [Chaenocephalus aceratus]